jgi:hypothetical protein
MAPCSPRKRRCGVVTPCLSAAEPGHIEPSVTELAPRALALDTSPNELGDNALK